MSNDRSQAKTLKSFPTAVATTLGWVDPAKGELLVSIRGLPCAVEWDRKTNTFSKDGKSLKTAEPVKVASVTAGPVDVAKTEDCKPCKSRVGKEPIKTETQPKKRTSKKSKTAE